MKTLNTVNTVREQTARLLATENITVTQDPHAPSAYFDLKTRTLALPVWKDMSNAMYDMLVGHEVGHALFTPNGNGGWVESAKRIAADAGFAGDTGAERVAQSFLNVVEDARIERLIKDRYPGLRRDFFTAYTEFAQRDIFGIKGADVRTLSLADRLNLHFKIGFTLPIQFSAQEQQFVQRMETAVTWEEVVAIATDLFNHKNDPKQGQGNQPQGGEGEEGEESSQGQGGGQGEGSDQGKSGKGSRPDSGKGKSGEGDADGEADGEGKSSDKSAQGQQGDGTEQGEGTDTQDADLDIDDAKSGSTSHSKGQGVNTAPVKPQEAKTASALDRAVSDMRDTRGQSRNYVHIPEMKDHSQFVIPFSQFIGACRNWEANGPVSSGLTNNAQARRNTMGEVDKKMADLVGDTKSSIQAFAREFEMLKTADEHRRTVESKSGRLDMDQAWKFRISDNLFKVATTMRDGKNHGFVMFIDWSGSMQPQMEQTMRQLYIMLQFCKKVGIPFDVYAFGIGVTDKAAFPYFGEDRKDRVVFNKARNECEPRVDLLHILSSRASARDIQDSFRYCLACSLYGGYYDSLPVCLGGSTPLDSTIVVAKDIVNTFRQQTKVQIVNTVFLTDGDATDNLLYYGTNPKGGWNAVTVLRDGHKEWADAGASPTSLLLQWFREQTGANALGIFVTSRFQYATHHISPSVGEETRKAAEKQFKRDGWCSIPALGFSEYFVLRGTVKDTEAAMDDFEAKDASTMTATQIKNAYIAAVESRNGARGMIHRMVKIVA
jgi:hypothetical protein